MLLSQWISTRNSLAAGQVWIPFQKAVDTSCLILRDFSYITMDLINLKFPILTLIPKSYFQKIEKGLHDVSSSYVTDPDGEKRGVYYSVTPNGWYSVITIPYDYLLRGTEKISIFYLSSIAFISILSVLFLVRDWHLNQKVKLTNDVVRVLGNSYYALYLVNVEQGTYTIIKASDYVRQNLPEKGTYMDFLHTLKDITQADVYHDIEQTFSLQNIRELVKKRVKNFGGDFQRLFNDQYRWVNIRMLFDELLRPNEVLLLASAILKKKNRHSSITTNCCKIL